MERDPRTVVETVWRLESPRLIAGLTRLVRDLSQAEDLAQEALVEALETWPRSGVPENPGAWLRTVAKNRAFDALRRRQRTTKKYEQLAAELRSPDETWAADAEALDNPWGDDLLRLIFLTCHPVLSMDARVSLILRLLGGLTTAEISRAFLVPEPTIAQRIVRAKRTLAAARAPFELPAPAELSARYESVLQVLYLIFNEGYSATSGDRWVRKELFGDALRMGRILASLSPEEPEVLGLAALMELQTSRLATRTTTEGEPILLLDQNRARWDRMLISRGLAALEQAERLGKILGPYCLQAAIAACHARAPRAQDTGWTQIAALYDAFVQIEPSPVVALNRAVAVGMAYGPAAGWDAVEEISSHPALNSYHLLPSVRADFLVKLGRLEQARTEFERAAALTQNLREREFLLRRARELS